MSEADRRKWDARYAEGAYAGRDHPSEYLVAAIADMPRGPALDLACGRGRNARFLADAGFTVDAVDISEVGLEAARAAAGGEAVNWIVGDLLENPDLPRRDYQLIIMFRFVAPALLRTLAGHLRPGGYLVVEEHLQTATPVAGPRSNQFRVAPGELVAAMGDLQVTDVYEGLVTDPDGVTSSVARVTARKEKEQEQEQTDA